MKIVRQCGILEIGELDEAPEGGPAVKVRTSDGDEILIPLTKDEARAVATADLLFRNLSLTITLEAE